MYQNKLHRFSSCFVSHLKEVRGFYEEQYAQESRFHTLRAQMLIHAVQLKRANDEHNSYMSKDKATKSTRFVEKIMRFFD